MFALRDQQLFALIGIACGAEYYYPAAAATVCVLAALTLVNKVTHNILTGFRTREFKVKLTDRPGVLNELRTRLEKRKVSILSLNAAMPDKKTLKIDMIIRMPSDLKMDALINLVNDIDETQSVQID